MKTITQVAVPILLGLAVALSGCAQTEATASSAPEGAVSSKAPDAPDVLNLFGIHGDYDEVHSAKELAEMSEIVIEGTLESIEDGPIVGYSEDKLSDIPVAVLSVGEVQVRQGELPPESDGNVYIVMVAPGGSEALRPALPPGTRVGLYGFRIKNEKSDGDIPMINAEAGRPPGQPIYNAYHPQGLVLEVDGTLYWPLAQVSEKGSLEDAMLDGTLVGSQRRPG